MNSLRAWHRWASTAAGLFILIIVFSGTWLHVDKAIGLSAAQDDDAPAPPPPMAPIDAAAQAQRAQAIIGRNHPGAAILSMKIDAKGGKPVAEVQVEKQSDPIRIDLGSGAEIPVMAAPEKPSLRKSIHRAMVNLHVIRFGGAVGHMFGAVLGALLLFLSGSGLWMWFKLSRERAKRNLGKWFWR